MPTWLTTTGSTTTGASCSAISAIRANTAHTGQAEANQLQSHLSSAILAWSTARHGTFGLLSHQKRCTLQIATLFQSLARLATASWMQPIRRDRKAYSRLLTGSLSCLRSRTAATRRQNAMFASRILFLPQLVIRGRTSITRCVISRTSSRRCISQGCRTSRQTK